MKKLLSFIHSLLPGYLVHRKLWYAALVLAGCSNLLYAQVPSFMKGPGTGGNGIPLNQESQKTQLLYTPGDFNTLPQSGRLVSIYMRNTVAGASATYTNLRVSFLQNSATAFSGTSYFTGLTTALRDTTITITGNAAAGGWFRIPLTVPFTYDSTKTLIVEIRYTARNGGMNTGTSTSTGSKRCSGTDTAAATGTANTIWNDFGMDVVPSFPCTSPVFAGSTVTNPATPVCATSTIELNVTNNTIGYGQTYKWQVADNSAGPYTDISDPLLIPRHLTAVPLYDAYYRSEVTCGGNSSYSAPMLVSVKPLMASGTYTVDTSIATGGSNFKTLAEAVAAINCGIAGPIVFNLSPITYSGRLLIGQIPGSSAANTVSFAGRGKGLTTLTAAATGTSDYATVLLNGSDNVSFTNMTISNTGISHGVGVMLTNGADSNTLRNVRIEVNPASTTSTTSGIVITGVATDIGGAGISGNYNTFDSLEVSGGHYGISVYGQSVTVRAKGNTVSNSIFTNQQWRGIRSFYATDYTIRNNTIGGFRNAANNFGMENYNVSNFRIENNAITAVSGLLLSSANVEVYDSSVTSIVVNNMVNSTVSGGYGITMSNAHHVRVLHNTFASIGTATYATAVFFNEGSHLDLRNNIFANLSTDANAYPIDLSRASISYFDSLDYNNYYAAGGGVVYIAANSGRSSLGAWRTEHPGFNNHSHNADPMFASGSLRLQYSSPLLPGAYTGIATDIDNNPRNLALPTAGAHEIGLPSLNASATEVVSPGAGFCKGTYPVRVKIINKGSSPITSMVINWSVNGVAGNPLFFAGTLDVQGSATGNDTIITVSNEYFAPGVSNRIIVSTSFPNGSQDTITRDDSVSVERRASLSDTLSIGSTGATFATFAEAAEVLNNFGVCGPVLINVQKGTYNERVILKEIPGASAVNTIVFTGAIKDSTRLTYRSTSTADLGTLVLNGSDYVTFRNLTIAAQDTTNGVAVVMANKADNNKLVNLNILTDTVARGAARGGVILAGSLTDMSVSTGGDAGNDNVFDSLFIQGGSFGIRFAGTSGKAGSRNIITNSRIRKQYGYGVHMNYQNDFVIRNNTITDNYGYTLAANLSNGIQFSYCSGFNIEGNTVTDAYSAIYCYQSNLPAYPGHGRIVNNIITSTNGSGINLYDSDSIDIYHNTVRGGGNSLITSMDITSSEKLNCRNNIFINPVTTETASAMSLDNNTTFISLDHNIYYSYGGGLMYRGGAAYSFTAWRAMQPMYNQNSTVVNPTFVSGRNLRLRPVGPIYYGTDAGVATDIDGTTRNNPPVIGAHERLPLLNSSYIETLIPQTFCAGTHPVSVKVKNAGTNVLNSLTINWEVDGSPMPSANITIPIDTLGSAAGNEQVVALGNLTFYVGTLTSVKVWVSNPNGMTDPYTEDDTISLRSEAALSGPFTIGGPSGSYPTITAAMNALAVNGICGNVTFDIEDGTYTGQLPFGTYASTDPSYRVTFQSKSLDSTKVILTWPSGTAATDNFLMKLDGTRNITFHKLTFSRTGTNNFSAIVNLNGTTGIRFLNNRFEAPTFTSTETDGVRSSIFSNDAVSEDSTTIENNFFSQNTNGIALFGNRNSPARGTVIRNNMVQAAYVNIWLKHNHSAKITGNQCHKTGTANIDFFGISLENCDSALEVSHNRITGYSRGTGLRLLGNNGEGDARARIFNNMISVSQASTNTATGISIESDANSTAAALDVVHNTVLIGPASASASRVIHMAGLASARTTDLRVMNNIFVNLSGGYIYNIPNNATTGDIVFNYNNLYASGANIGTWNSAVPIANDGLRSWISVANRDSLSSNVNISVVHADTLRLAGASLTDLNLATPVVNLVTDDAYGNARTGTWYFKGAYEHSTALNFGGEADMSMWAVINPKAPLNAAGTQDVVVRVRNNGISTVTSLQISCMINSVGVGPASWSGTLEPGAETLLDIDNVPVPAGRDTLKVWVHTVNSLSQDLNRNNDSLTVLFIASTPLSGSYDVGTGQSFVNLTAIADTLRSRVLGGDVTFNLTSTYNSATETFPVSFTAPSSGSYSVTIRPASGVTNIVTKGDPGSALPLIDLNGSANIILDGRAAGAGASQWTIRNTRQASTIGSVIRLINGATGNQLRYLRIEGQAPTGHGLVFFSTAASALTGNNNNLVEYCTLGNRSDTTALDYFQAILSNGTAGNFNSNNTVRYNQAYNFTNNGIFLTTGTGSGWTIEGNHFYNNRTTAPTPACNVINLSPDASATGYTVASNVIGGSAAGAAGASWKHNGNAVFTGITSSVRGITISNNTIRNIEMQNIGTSVRLCGIDQNLAGSKAVISGNRITNLQTASRNTAFPLTGLFAFTGINNRAGDSIVVYGNVIDTVTVSGTAASTDITAAGISVTEIGYAGVYGNRIGNISNLTTGVSRVAGIIILNVPANAQHHVYNNSVSLRGTGRMHGIMHQNTLVQQGNIYITNNSVYLGGTQSGAGVDYAFYRNAGSAVLLQNNIFYSERSGNGTAVFENSNQSGLTANYNFYVHPGNAFSTGDFASWKTSGTDRFSYNATPAQLPAATVFTNAASGDLSVTATHSNSWAFNGKGTPDARVATDMAGNPRNTTAGIPTDLGAYEFTPSGAGAEPAAVQVAPAMPATVLYVYNRPVATIDWRSGTLPDQVSLKYFSGLQPADATIGNNIRSYYAIDATGGSGYEYDLALAYTPAELGTVSEGNLAIAKRTGSGTWNFRSASTVQPAGFTVKDTVFNSFSLFTLTDRTNPLPVKLISFSGRAEQGDAVLTWTTASERNAGDYVVEASGDAKTFKVIGRQKAVGNSSVTNTYGLTHRNASHDMNGAQVIYYRLTAIDKDGSASAPQVIPVHFRPQAHVLAEAIAYPNPFVSEITLRIFLASDAPLNVTVTDMQGRLVRSLHARGSAGTNEINLHQVEELEQGVYFINIHSGTESAVLKVVK